MAACVRCLRLERHEVAVSLWHIPQEWNKSRETQARRLGREPPVWVLAVGLCRPCKEARDRNIWPLAMPTIALGLFVVATLLSRLPDTWHPAIIVVIAVAGGLLGVFAAGLLLRPLANAIADAAFQRRARADAGWPENALAAYREEQERDGL